MNVKRIIQIALSVAIIFTLEQALVFLPNVQLTTLLILIFVSVYSFKESVVMISIYVILDTLFFGGFNLFYMVPMLIAWNLIPIAYHTFLQNTNNEIKLGIFVFVFGFVYGWIFIPFNMIYTGIDEFWPYLTADILFEVIMAVTNLLTVLWLYKPMMRIIEHTSLLEDSNVELSYNK